MKNETSKPCTYCCNIGHHCKTSSYNNVDHSVFRATGPRARVSGQPGQHNGSTLSNAQYRLERDIGPSAEDNQS